MTLKKIKDENNVIGFDIIEIIQFNYDGKGGALVKNDGILDSYVLIDLDYILFGDSGTGEKYYELIE